MINMMIALFSIILIPLVSASSMSDTLLVSTVEVGPGIHAVAVPVYLYYEPNICSAEINVRWSSGDENTDVTAILPGIADTWTFFQPYIDNINNEIFITGNNNSIMAGRILAFYIQFAIGTNDTERIDILRGNYQLSTYDRCDSAIFIAPRFVAGGVIIHSSRPPGDANGSFTVNGLDVVYLVNYLKGFGPPPEPLLAADANGDCTANGLDAVYLINYLKGGSAPILGNCP
jgi:hypothetical protein